MTGKLMKELLFRASLVAVPLGQACCGGNDVTAHATRAKYAALIDACLADAKSCDTLCYDVMEEQGIGAMYDDYDVTSCAITAQTADDVTLAISYDGNYECGRRPRGLVEPVRCDASAGSWLAKVAAIEAASITAFARLARQLVRFGAPAWATAGAREAILDEIVHTQLVARLARALGAEVAAPDIAREGDTTLADLALDNAVHGQVGETFGALLALCMARGATSPAVRATFARIAVDEARHAALAHRLAPWLADQLDATERAAIADAEHSAAAAIGANPDFVLPESARRWLGIPEGPRLAAAFVALRASSPLAFLGSAAPWR